MQTGWDGEDVVVGARAEGTGEIAGVAGEG